MLKQLEWWVQNGPITKNGVLLELLYFLKILFQFKNPISILFVSAAVSFGGAFSQWESLRTVHNLLSVTTNTWRGVLLEKASETFKQNPWKTPKKKFTFRKVAGFKIEFIHTYLSRYFLKV